MINIEKSLYALEVYKAGKLAWIQCEVWYTKEHVLGLAEMYNGASAWQERKLTCKVVEYRRHAEVIEND
jgi:hypothetical protein